MFNQITKPSLADIVFSKVTSKILEGDLDAGSPLPSERSLGEQLGINRGAIREGIKRLQQAGLVEVRHGGTTTILDYEESGGLELLPHLMLSPEGVVRVEVARSIINMRQSMTPDIARSCALKRKDKTVLALQSLLAQMKETNDVEALQKLALKYWQEVVSGGGNIAYRLAFNSLQKAYKRVWNALGEVLRAELEDIDNLTKLTQAIADKNPDFAHHFASAYLMNGTNAMNAALNEYAHQEIIE